MCCSFVVTGGVCLVTGSVRVAFWGLSKRFIAILTGLTGVIGGFGHETILEVKRSRKCRVSQPPTTPVDACC
jgi:hypothetical protein